MRPNLTPRVIDVDNKPRIYFEAAENIKKGKEVVFDYNERDPAVIQEYPFLKR